MKIKTTELTGKALDWAVGVAVGYKVKIDSTPNPIMLIDGIYYNCRFTTNWGQLGPLVDRELITVTPHAYGNGPCLEREWIATKSIYGVLDVPDSMIGKKFYDHDYKIAACRAIVAAKIGDEIDVPEVLV